MGIRGEVKTELKSGLRFTSAKKKVLLVVSILAHGFGVSELRVYSSMVSFNTWGEIGFIK